MVGPTAGRAETSAVTQSSSTAVSLAVPGEAGNVAGSSAGTRSMTVSGRESGCCTELFDLFRPQLVIISDDERQFDSQDTDDWYRNQCTGAIFTANPGARRYVATTRKDGSMRIDVDAAGRWSIGRVLVRDWPRSPIPAPPREAGLGALASLGLDHNPLAALLSAFSPLPAPSEPELNLRGLLNIEEDPLSRALGLGSLLAPTPGRR